MGHKTDPDQASPARALRAEDAEQIAKTMAVLATPSRVRLLAHLRHAPATVTELAHAVDMAASAVSQQLRILRNLGLATAHRRGRHMIYTLHDSHVANLLDEAIGHNEHRKLAQLETAEVADHESDIQPPRSRSRRTSQIAPAGAITAA
jgi:DNA-binding transcriptional ArsR family regulator